MRNSIVYFLLLFTSFNVTAFQPPEQPEQPAKKMQISPQEFQELAKPKSSSYLSLLPADISGMVSQYAYSELPEVIAALRQKYLDDPATRDKFLNDESFNQKIITDLDKQFDKWQIYIATMLNTPASFNILESFFYRPPGELERILQRFYHTFYDFLNKAPLSYSEVIKYAQSYIENVTSLVNTRLFYNTYGSERHASLLREFVDNVIFKIAQKYGNELRKTYAIPEIKIAVDLANVNALNWLQNLLLISDEDLLHKGIISRYADVHHYKLTQVGMVAANLGTWRVINAIIHQFRINACNQIELLLLEAIKNNNIPQINFLLKIITAPKSLHESIKQCIQAKLQQKLGDGIINHILNSDQNISLLLTYDMFLSPQWHILLKHAMNNSSASSHKIIQLLEYLTDWSEDKDKIDLLIAAIQSPYMDADIINYLLQSRKFVIDVNGSDENGITFLMHAIKNKRFDMAQVLLNQPGINVNACDRNGWENALSNAQMLPASPQKDILIATLKERGAKEVGICAIQ